VKRIALEFLICQTYEQEDDASNLDHNFKHKERFLFALACQYHYLVERAAASPGVTSPPLFFVNLNVLKFWALNLNIAIFISITVHVRRI
jgi:hypothetical protein